MIRRSSSVILVSTHTRISVSLGSIGRLSFCTLSSITGMLLISFFFHHLCVSKFFSFSKSTSVSHSFVLMILAWSASLCSVISKVPISLQIAVVRFFYPLLVGSLWSISSPVCFLPLSTSFSPSFQLQDLFPLLFPHALLCYLPSYLMFLCLLSTNRFYQNYGVSCTHLSSPDCWSLRLLAKLPIKFELLLVSIRIN